ncbi:hypothetical protein BURMUCF2_1675, partial [Burkholderia multivorans CF2]
MRSRTRSEVSANAPAGAALGAIGRGAAGFGSVGFGAVAFGAVAGFAA